MQEKHLFEYAVIRIVPRVERQEFLNVGVILFCKSKKFLDAAYHIEKSKLLAFCEKAEIEEIESYLETFVAIAQGQKTSSIISSLPLAERFRWLTAKRSTILQTSAVHPGFCIDPAETLEKLFRQMVM